MSWQGESPVRIEEGVSLAERTTWRIGGRARYYAEPHDIVGVAALLDAAQRHDLRVWILGGGSNLLVSDDRLDGLVIRLRAGADEDLLQRVPGDPGCVVAHASAPLGRLVHWAAKHGLGGLEEMAGIPGTLGGAVVMNAGSPTQGIGRLVERVVAVAPGGDCQEIPRKGLQFGYRKSNLAGSLVTEVVLRLQPDEAQAVTEATRRYMEGKRQRHPLSARTAGCVFRNPPGASAGILIDEAGLKGYRVGDALVSERHANFIVNAGRATCADVLAVIDHVRKVVDQRFDVSLDLEIKLWQ